MDRNANPGSTTLTFPVALRKESVDRNFDVRNPATTLPRSLSARRAWIEIGIGLYLVTEKDMSLSARRAWIEISGSTKPRTRRESLSARRAWIEILEVLICGEFSQSLSARRAWIEICPISAPCEAPTSRSPQGERG